MSKVGRKRRAEQHTSMVGVRMTADERRHFEKAAKSANISFSEWLRRAAEWYSSRHA